MKKNFVPVIFSACMIIFCGSARQKSDTERQPAAIPAINERVWLSELQDSSMISSLDFWPRDSFQNRALSLFTLRIRNKLLYELKRSEKFGLYKMVDDSAQATIRVTLKLARQTIEGDSIIVPLRLYARSMTDKKQYFFNFKLSAKATRVVSTDKRFHYSGGVISDLQAKVPYGEIVRIFCNMEQ